jgi:adenosylcobinamide-GDP ribazoletransferase
VVILALLLFGFSSVWFLLVTLSVTGITGQYYLKRLGGVTGDCFGATIKITEVCIYMTAVVLYHV